VHYLPNREQVFFTYVQIGTYSNDEPLCRIISDTR